MSEIITSDDILGKEAIAPNGKLLGTVTKLHIDKISKQVTGITIDLGVLEPDLFVSLDHVTNFGIDTVILNIMPPRKVSGCRVFTNSGKYLGKVIHFDDKSGKIENIHVRKKIFSSKIKKINKNNFLTMGKVIIVKD